MRKLDKKNSDAFVFDLLDYLLIFVENLLAIRVVFSYLGSQETFVHFLSNFLLFPLSSLIRATTLVSDSSRLELFTAGLVVALFYLHRFLDRKRLAV